MKIKIIGAVSLDGVIGVGDYIPWELPEDLLFYKNHTINKYVVVGRNTYENLPYKAKLNRKYVVLTSTEIDDSSVKPHRQFSNLNDLFVYLKQQNLDEVYVAGGRQVYDQLLIWCNELIITLVDIFVKEEKFKNEIIYFPLDKLNRYFKVKDSGTWKVSRENELRYRHVYYEKDNK